MQRVKILVFILLGIFLISCASEEKTRQAKTENTESNLKSAASEYLGKDFTSIYNTAKDFVICIQNGSPDVSKRFFVFDIEGDSTIFRDNIINGEVKWEDDYNIAVIEFPGIVQKNNQTVKSKYKYNVLRKIKYN